MGRDETPITLAGRTIGVGLCVPALLLPTLHDGGVAPLAVAAATAALVGVPTAQAEWRSAVAARTAWAGAAARTARVAGLLLVAAVAAPLVHEAGVSGAVLCVAGWAGALAVAERPRLAAGMALALVALAFVRGAVGLALSPGLTLLSPVWGTWHVWLSSAILAGVLAGGAGLSPWSAGPRRAPGHDETPWVVAGASILFATLVAVQEGARFEATLGGMFDNPGRDALLAGAALLGAATVVGPRIPQRSGSGGRAALGAAATVWLAWPGLGAVPLVLAGIVPVLAAVPLLHVARAFGRTAPVLSVAALAIIVAVVGLGSLPMPASVTAGAAVGLLLVIAFWIVATRTLLAEQEPG